MWLPALFIGVNLISTAHHVKLTSISSIAATTYHWMGRPTAHWGYPSLICNARELVRNA